MQIGRNTQKSQKAPPLKNITIPSLNTPNYPKHPFQIHPSKSTAHLPNLNNSNCAGKQSSVCAINSDFLNGKGVKPIHRMQLKLWFMTQMKNFRFSRQTYAIASRFLDEYFARGKDVQTKSFQNLGISCFMLAAKSNQGESPKFSFQNYGIQEIFQFEKSIFELLEFNVFPTTYFHLAQILMYEWDKFACQNCLNVQYFEKSQISLQRYRKILDILEMIDLVPKVHHFRLEDLALNCFYAQNYLFLSDLHQQYQQELVINKCFPLSLTKLQKYPQLFQKFIRFLNPHQHFTKSQIQPQILKFLEHFLHSQLIYTGQKFSKPFEQISSQEHRIIMLLSNVNPSHEKIIKPLLKNQILK